MVTIGGFLLLFLLSTSSWCAIKLTYSRDLSGGGELLKGLSYCSFLFMTFIVFVYFVMTTKFHLIDASFIKTGIIALLLPYTLYFARHVFPFLPRFFSNSMDWVIASRVFKAIYCPDRSLLKGLQKLFKKISERISESEWTDVVSELHRMVYEEVPAMLEKRRKIQLALKEIEKIEQVDKYQWSCVELTPLNGCLGNEKVLKELQINRRRLLLALSDINDNLVQTEFFLRHLPVNLTALKLLDDGKNKIQNEISSIQEKIRASSQQHIELNASVDREMKDLLRVPNNTREK